MISQYSTWRALWPFALALLPLSLWLMLIFSLQPGSLSDIKHPGSGFRVFIDGIRAALPLAAAFVATTIILFKLRRRTPNRIPFLGPIGLTVLYGLVGIVASLLSPDGSIALYWSISYISVPLVLWSIVMGPEALESTYRVVYLTLSVVVLAAGILLIFAFLKLDFFGFITDPSSWLDCTHQGWYKKSSNYVRQTGVARLIAITAIIAMVRLWLPTWKGLWAIVLIVSVILLLHTAARTAFVGFIVAVPIVVLLSGGQRAAVVSAIIAVLIVPVFWSTGIHDDFMYNCIFRSEKPSPANASALIVSPSEKPDPANTSALIVSPSEKPGLSLSSNEQTSSVESKSNLTNAPGKTNSNSQEAITDNITNVDRIPPGFFGFSGRTEIWSKGLEVFGESPLLGRGFHADRLLLKTHAHNSIIQALVQTGLLGTLPLIAGLILGWVLLLKSLQNLTRFSAFHKTMVIQTAGVLAFLSVRSITESTGAFFSVDWLILAPHLLYVQIINSIDYEGNDYNVSIR